MTFFKSLKHNKLLIISIIGITLIFFIAQWFQNEFVFDRTLIDTGHWWKIVSGNFYSLKHPSFTA